MIIEARDDVIRLTGAMEKNAWSSIQAALNFLLKDRPKGIIVDCLGLRIVSEEGADTFLEMIEYTQAKGKRILFCNLPENAREQVKRIPGLRSQLPIANSLEEARQSLEV
ncbi:MAG TPA: STAS domain-containing protein [Armatimonadota bacterium]|jgi:anti-anti-sigma regulatory factor